MRLAAVFHPKARLWVRGRQNWRPRYAAAFQPTGKVLWIHAASLGEFEQGRPVIERWRERYPDWQIVLTFYSPSGYEMRKNYPLADFVCYLPADTIDNARKMVAWLRPDLAIFIKYEFWYNYLHVLREQQVPVWLISAVFRPEQPFFKPWGWFWRDMLGCFQYLFVQDERSVDLLQSVVLQQYVILAGDTRIDRVLHLSETAPLNPVLEAWQQVSDRPLLVIGSSWPEDEAVIFKVLKQPEFQHFRYVIAPHEPSPGYIAALKQRLTGRYFLFSAYQDQSFDLTGFDGAVVDSVGILNTLYRYGAIAYIGGGFGKGIHNTLEPAAWALPVVFGPNYHKFEEARQLLSNGGAYCVQSPDDLAQVLRQLSDPDVLSRSSAAAKQYLLDHQGATELILMTNDE